MHSTDFVLVPGMKRAYHFGLRENQPLHSTTFIVTSVEILAKSLLSWLNCWFSFMHPIDLQLLLIKQLLLPITEMRGDDMY